MISGNCSKTTYTRGNGSFIQLRNALSGSHSQSYAMTYLKISVEFPERRFRTWLSSILTLHFSASVLLDSPFLRSFKVSTLLFHVLPCRPAFAFQWSSNPSLCWVTRSLSTAHSPPGRSSALFPYVLSLQTVIAKQVPQTACISLLVEMLTWVYKGFHPKSCAPRHELPFPFTAFHTFPHSCSYMAFGTLARLTVTPDMEGGGKTVVHM